MDNIFLVEDYVYDYLKKYIKNNAKITTKVSKFVIEKQNPLIVFEEERNSLNSWSTTYDNKKRALSYRIDVYCNKLPNCKNIVKELINLINYVMEDIFHMNGGVIASVHNYDGSNESSFNATLRYTTTFDTTYNKIY